VAINAQLAGDGSSGGVEQALASLLRILAAFPAPDMEFVVLVGQRDHGWVSNGLGPPLRAWPNPGTIIPHTRPGQPTRVRLRIHVSQLVSVARRLGAIGRGRRPITSGDAWLERAGCDVVHFPYQDAFRTAVPSIFNPWDLQHLSLEHLFTPDIRADRSDRYAEACARAQRVLVATQWTRRDVHARLGVEEEKIVVIPVAPFNEGRGDVPASELADVQQRLRVRPPFLLYPAQAFPHKNHLRLLEALVELRHTRPDVSCVFTGASNPFDATVSARTRELGLSEHVRSLGYVEARDLRALYRLCRAVVFPSTYEGLGLPLLEAFAEGAPVASSSATCLPEVGGDAALYFSPDDVREMVDALAALWDSADRRQDLVGKGTRRLALFTGPRVALAYQGLYRSAAGRELRDDERGALESFGNRIRRS
jgi:glycosyltransferase involved in cell wall biosynthesis